MRHPRANPHANTKEPWTDELIAELTDMLAAGRSIPEIAAEMGRSQEAVRGKAWKHGLLSPKKRSDQDERLSGE